VLAAVAGILAMSAASAAATAQAVTQIGITVADLDRSVAFYTQVLGFDKASEIELEGDTVERLLGVFPARIRVARLTLGAETLELTDYLAPASRAFPADSNGNDRWFQHIAIVVSDMDRAYARLREHGVQHASPSPQTLPDWNPKAGGIRAFYFRDPDGHYLELIQFPAGKGNPRWQGADDAPRKLFLGIDHTAIVVASTDASLRFYRDLLGMRVVGASENYGIEQERLNAVRGAHLRITTLASNAGPGVELLEYLAPRTGRAAAADASASDLAHWQTRLVVNHLDGVEMLRDVGAALVSSGVIAGIDRSLGFDRGILVRDPDGHGVEIVEDEHAR
jgi:catechol 2,3-dioxygenase-like lactoylglutathione lyase family enzyme